MAPIRLYAVAPGLLGAALVLAGCEANTAPNTELIRPVQVQHVDFKSAEQVRDFVGVVRARHETDLGFRVGGKIVTRLVDAGDSVRKGDVVARLDPDDFELQVASAKAALAAAKSSLVQASADFERFAILRRQGFATIADYDRKKAAMDEAEGRVEQAQRAFDLVGNQLSYADLKADSDGVVTATLAEPGQVVTAGQTVIRLAHSGQKEAVIALPETWLGQVQQAKAEVRLWSNAGRAYEARLRELSPQADPATRTYAARFTILDADDDMALGMTATVSLARSGDDPIARLPLSAVLDRGAGPIVYVVDRRGALTARPVIVSAYENDAALVTSGLHDGEAIVTLGVQKLQAGEKVRVIEAR
jgi:RND family efflux transporter MFP subunit